MASASDDAPDRDWSVREYLQLHEGTRYELLEGELVPVPLPGFAHQRVTTRLGTVLDSIALAYDLGVCFDAPLEVVLGKQTVVQPDLMFWGEQRDYRILQDRAIVGIPDMVVEVTTPTTAAYARGVKRELYAKAGVPWFLLVDVESRTAETYRLTDSGAYSWSQTAAGDDILQVPPYPDLSVELSKLWPDPG